MLFSAANDRKSWCACNHMSWKRKINKNRRIGMEREKSNKVKLRVEFLVLTYIQNTGVNIHSQWWAKYSKYIALYSCLSFHDEKNGESILNTQYAATYTGLHSKGLYFKRKENTTTTAANICYEFFFSEFITNVGDLFNWISKMYIFRAKSM